MTERAYFGTDGIRGEVGSELMNPELVLKLGWAMGTVLGSGSRKKVLIGKDTRISGYMFESALEAGLSAAGIDVCLLGPMPTPAIAYLTRTLRASAGIVISASHNLFQDNGIKFFSSEGEKLPDSMELAIEKQMHQAFQTVKSSLLGKAMRIDDAPGRYIEFCKSTIPSLTRLSGLKIVIDCAHGATYYTAPNVFAELGADVVCMGDKPDGFNINRECGSTDPESMRQLVLKSRADIGISLDGDGDRVILCDSQGRIINGDNILYIIAKDRQQRGLLQGGIVGTLMSNFALEKAILAMGLDFVRAKVGDRYVLETLKQKNWKIGGEPSGHVVCLDKTTTGDGIVAALQILAIMIKTNQPLADLSEKLTLLPQSLVNLKTKNAIKLSQNARVQTAVGNLDRALNREGRVILRPSGTEPMLRVMVEGHDSFQVQTYAEGLSKEIGLIERDLISNGWL